MLSKLLFLYSKYTIKNNKVNNLLETVRNLLGGGRITGLVVGRLDVGGFIVALGLLGFEPQFPVVITMSSRAISDK